MFCPLSKHFQLLRRRSNVGLVLAIKQLHISKLFVGNAHNPNVPFIGQKPFYALDVNVGILTTSAMSHIHRKLKHRKTVSHQILAKQSVRFTLFLCFRRQIKKYKYPHNSIFAEAFHKIFRLVYFSLLTSKLFLP